MVGKKGLSALLWVILVVVVLAVAYTGWNYYNATISGAGTQVVATQCIANPELASWADVDFAKLGVANFDELNTKCNERLVSIGCNGWDVPSSSLKACVWNVNCGNGVIDAPLEQCEGANLNGKTCASYGFASGTISCRNDCKVDLTDCY